MCKLERLYKKFRDMKKRRRQSKSPVTAAENGHDQSESAAAQQPPQEAPQQQQRQQPAAQQTSVGKPPVLHRFQFAELNLRHTGNAERTLNLVKRAVRMGYDSVAINIDVGDFLVDKAHPEAVCGPNVF